MNRAATVIIILFVITVLTFALAGTTRADIDDLTYIALGDSVASGNAVTDPGATPCQRGDESYPTIVRRELSREFDVTFHHLACSGARVVDPHDQIQRCYAEMSATTPEQRGPREDCELKSVEHQVTHALDLIDDRLTLVTLTVGANDTSWTDPLTIIGLLLAPDDNFRAGISEITADLQRTLTAQVDRLLEHDGVTIVLTDYYNPLNAESNLYDLIRGAQAVAWGADNVGDRPCTGTDRDGNRHNLSCAERFAYAIDSLNASLAAVAEIGRNRILLASVFDRFQGHEAPKDDCGQSPPASGASWIRGAVDSGIFRRPDCFHPNPLGAEAIAREVLATWEQSPH